MVYDTAKHFNSLTVFRIKKEDILVLALMSLLFLFLSLLSLSHTVLFEWDVMTTYSLQAIDILKSDSIPIVSPTRLDNFTPLYLPVDPIVKAYSIFLFGNYSFRLLSLMYFTIFLTSVYRITINVLSNSSENNSYLLINSIYVTTCFTIIYYVFHQNANYPDFLSLAFISIFLWVSLMVINDNDYTYAQLGLFSFALMIFTKAQTIFLIPFIVILLPVSTRVKKWGAVLFSLPFFIYLIAISLPNKYGVHGFESYVFSAFLFILTIFLFYRIIQGTTRNLKSFFICVLPLVLPLAWAIRNFLLVGIPTYPVILSSLVFSKETLSILESNSALLGKSFPILAESLYSTITILLKFCFIGFTNTSLGSCLLYAKLRGFNYLFRNKLRLMLYLSAFYLFYVFTWLFCANAMFMGASARFALPILPILFILVLVGLYDLSIENRLLTSLYIAGAIAISLSNITLSDYIVLKQQTFTEYDLAFNGIFWIFYTIVKMNRFNNHVSYEI